MRGRRGRDWSDDEGQGEGRTMLGQGVEPLPGGGGIYKSAAVAVLRQERRLMTTGEITRLALERGIIIGQVKTPDSTMASALYTDVKRKRERSVFTRPQEGLFGLREWLDEGFYPDGWVGPLDGLGPSRRTAPFRKYHARVGPGPVRGATGRAAPGMRMDMGGGTGRGRGRGGRGGSRGGGRSSLGYAVPYDDEDDDNGGGLDMLPLRELPSRHTKQRASAIWKNGSEDWGEDEEGDDDMDDDDDEGYEGEDGDYGTSEGGDEGVVGHHQGHSMPPRYMGSGGRHLTPQQQHIMDMEELGAPSSSQPSGTASPQLYGQRRARSMSGAMGPAGFVQGGRRDSRENALGMQPGGLPPALLATALNMPGGLAAAMAATAAGMPPDMTGMMGNLGMPMPPPPMPPMPPPMPDNGAPLDSPLHMLGEAALNSRGELEGGLGGHHEGTGSGRRKRDRPSHLQVPEKSHLGLAGNDPKSPFEDGLVALHEVATSPNPMAITGVIDLTRDRRKPRLMLDVDRHELDPSGGHNMMGLTSVTGLLPSNMFNPLSPGGPLPTPLFSPDSLLGGTPRQMGTVAGISHMEPFLIQGQGLMPLGAGGGAGPGPSSSLQLGPPGGLQIIGSSDPQADAETLETVARRLEQKYGRLNVTVGKAWLAVARMWHSVACKSQSQPPKQGPDGSAVEGEGGSNGTGAAPTTTTTTGSSSSVSEILRALESLRRAQTVFDEVAKSVGSPSSSSEMAPHFATLRQRLDELMDAANKQAVTGRLTSPPPAAAGGEGKEEQPAAASDAPQQQEQTEAQQQQQQAGAASGDGTGGKPKQEAGPAGGAAGSAAGETSAPSSQPEEASKQTEGASEPAADSSAKVERPVPAPGEDSMMQIDPPDVKAEANTSVGTQ